ncbi:U3 snoRNP protein, partial [Nowakowskiella sp. JEL0078]
MGYSKSVIQSAKFHPTAPVLMTAGFDRTLRLFQIDGKINPKIQSVFIKDFPISNASFTADGKEVILTGKRKHMYIYSLEAGRFDRVFGVRGREEHSFERHFISPCNKQIAVTGRDGNILMLDRVSKNWIGGVKMNANVKDLKYSSDGMRMLSLAINGDVYQWDLRNRKCIHRFRDVGVVKATCLDVSADEKYLALGMQSGIVNVYSLADCQETSQPTPLKSIMNLTTSVSSVNFHPDSQLLAIASRAKKDSLKLVNLNTMSVYAKWPTANTPLSYVNTLEFSPSGGYISMGNDKGK